MNRVPFAPNEWYHCFNRGVDKRKVFMNQADYERFLMLLYLANDRTPVHISENRYGTPATLAETMNKTKTSELVHIGAYCLMPNHFHLLLCEATEGGIASFMQKVGTGYTMYFNKKESRTGSLFEGRFKSRHVKDDRYMKRVANYIHANPAEMVEPRWKKGAIKQRKRTEDFLSDYPYSSLYDYIQSEIRPQESLLNRGALLDCYDDLDILYVSTLLKDAIDFAQDYEVEITRG